MDLPKNFYAPFDITYTLVTDKISRHCVSVKDPNTVKWLETLVHSFWEERRRWPDNPLASAAPPYDKYMRVASGLRGRIFQLIACAYLHISYDLPRVLADEWPASGNWKSGPDEFSGENAYFALRGIFPAVMNELHGNRAVVGLPSYILRIAPSDAIKALAMGIGNLRSAPWIHARRLHVAGSSARKTIEPKMIEAMTAALTDVQHLKPWTIGLISPPDSAVLNSYVIAAATLKDVTSLLDDPRNTLLLIVAWAGAMGWFLWFRQIKQYQRNELLEFIEEFRRRAMDYVDVAMRDPEALDECLRRLASRPVNGRGPRWRDD